MSRNTKWNHDWSTIKPIVGTVNCNKSIDHSLTNEHNEKIPRGREICSNFIHYSWIDVQNWTYPEWWNNIFRPIAFDECLENKHMPAYSKENRSKVSVCTRLRKKFGIPLLGQKQFWSIYAIALDPWFQFWHGVGGDRTARLWLDSQAPKML